MADEEQVRRLRAGVEGWNAWREVNPDIRVDLQNADLRDVNLQNADLRHVNLKSADLRSAKLRRADLQNADLRNTYLRRANLQNAYVRSAKLQGANLQRTRLQRASLQRANLQRAKLQRANLQGALLQGANLQAADLQGADLQSAEFQGANLQRASLRNSNLHSASLQSAYLRSARLDGVRLKNTGLDDVGLNKVEGLSKVEHAGPSTVDHRTLARSQGQIPEVFLRGCGFQDWEIEAAKLHDPDLSRDEVTDIGYRVIDLKSRSPIQINPIFISYSRDDSAFVEAIEPLLDEKGIRYWRDVHDMTAGPLDEQIERAIRLNPTYLLVLSERSIESDWVEWEAQKARDLEKELRREGDHRHVLCPVALDESWKDAAWPRYLKHQIQKYNILDFSQWRDVSAMRGMFGRLLDGLGIYYRADSPDREAQSP